MKQRLAIVGLGRAGGAFSLALERAGWTVTATFGRADDPSGAGDDVDLVLITTPDAAIAETASRIEPTTAVVAHAAGSLGLDVVGMHPAHGAMHPLMSLPTPEVGAERLAGGWFAVAGDQLLIDVVESLGGRHFALADPDRPTYHATAAIAANHLVALMAQVERLAGSIGVPAEAFVDLAAGSIESVRELGAVDALTGPARRGDADTIDRHLAALPESEQALYRTMMEAAGALAEQARQQEGTN